MAIIIAQQLNQYYENYQNTEVAFTKEIIKALALDPRQIYLKCTEGQWPCIINSLSFSTAKIIIGTKSGGYEQMAKPQPPVMNLRLCFYRQDGTQFSFFIACKVKGLSPYANSKDLVIVTLQYSQRPPDDLIERMGHLIEANTNAIRRKEERIVITPEVCRKLGIPKEECIALVQNVPRHCILRDISFGGAKIIILGLAKFLQDKEVQLDLEFDEPHEVIQLKGTITATSPIEGRSDMVVANIKYDESTISLSYKIHINNYLTTVRKADLDNQLAGGQPAPQNRVIEEI